MQIVASYAVKTQMVRSGSLLNLGNTYFDRSLEPIYEETTRARSSLDICSAALVAGSCKDRMSKIGQEAQCRPTLTIRARRHGWGLSMMPARPLVRRC
jgi:hypothetical protein